MEDDPLAEKPAIKKVWEAVKEGNLEEVRRSIESGEDVSLPNPVTLDTPLLIAAKTAHKEMLTFLLSKGASVTNRNRVGDTALHWAAFKGDEELVLLLLSKGADKDARGEFSNTPLHLACCGNHYSVANILLQEGASVTIRNDFGNTPHRISMDSKIKQMLKVIMLEGEPARELLRLEELKKRALKKEAEELERLRQQELDIIKREQETYDRERMDAIHAEERRIEEEDAAREHAKEEELRRQIFACKLRMAPSRKPCFSIDSVLLFNETDDNGLWVPRKYSKNSWVLMHPSSRGAF
ncbi:hypothetical protein O6H91_17G044500 [Diphasiastrum complanatum]|uniref:Uncharacterized protein n=1 Tax=Diphasiastrum complanatum TaxID=34168 RepID=A0ACC2B6A3_DIPCM|nr:hypothetical protein O6H91_17G044500 [Diphasiastrum complanatum]